MERFFKYNSTMDLLMVSTTIAFICLMGIAGFMLFKDTKEKPVEEKKEKASSKNTEDSLIARLEKRVASGEERTASLEEDLKNAREELRQAAEREQALLKEKSQAAFDSAQFEKFKKDFAVLKKEAGAKEKTLEEEISRRLRHGAELLETQKERDEFKRKWTQAEDALRTSQASAERLSQERDAARKIIADQKKIVQEHAKNKSGGEWVARQELEKLELELREKETLLQKLLSLKPPASPPASNTPL